MLPITPFIAGAVVGALGAILLKKPIKKATTKVGSVASSTVDTVKATAECIKEKKKQKECEPCESELKEPKNAE